MNCLTQILDGRREPAAVDLPARVVPILLSERARWTPLLRTAFEQDEGLVVDSTLCGRGVSCGNVEAEAPHLLTAIEELLTAYNATDSSANLRLVLEGGQARIDGDEAYESVNKGQQAFRETLASVCHDELRASEFTTLITAADALDANQVEAIWQLLMELPRLLSSQPGSLLVILAGDATVDFGGPHFSGDPSAQFIVDRWGLRARRSFRQNESAVSELNFSKEEMPLVVLFLGAGASTAVGLPLGNKLRDEAVAHLMREPLSSDTPEQVAARFFGWLKESDYLTPAEVAAGVDSFVESLTLERVLAVEQEREGKVDCHTLRSFREHHAQVRASLDARQDAGEFDDDPLVKLLKLQRRLVLVTVNFDQVVEAKAPGLIKPFVTDQDFAGLAGYLAGYASNGGKVPLLKMHGDIDEPNSIVANLDQTQAGLSLARAQGLNALVALHSDHPLSPWWYVGYSMRDRDLASVWTGGAFADSMMERWVSPTVDDSVRAFITQHRMVRWSDAPRRNYTADSRTITTTASDFFKMLFEVAATW